MNYIDEERTDETEEDIIKRNIENVLKGRELDRPLSGLGPNFKIRVYKALEKEELAKEAKK